MTTPEHTLVGVLGALSLGLHRKLGWQAVVFAGIVSNLPDWDGLPMFIDMPRYESGHRVWGHNLLAIGLSGFCLAWLQARTRIIEHIVQRLQPIAPSDATLPGLHDCRPISFPSLVAIAIGFQGCHLICDMTVSGGKGLSDWKVLPYWPFSSQGFVLPLIPWGDLGPTIIMMVTLVVCATNRKNVGLISSLGLVVLIVYMLLRGIQRGVIL